MKILFTVASICMSTHAAPTITPDEYNAVSEGLSSIHGDDMWGILDYAGTNTVNLSYNAFTNTSLAALDFRVTNLSVALPAYDPAVDGPAYERLIHHLDLSHNLITDASLDFFRLELIGDPAGVRDWHLITLDLSYNKITNLSHFPTKKARGYLAFVNLEHNLINQLGTQEPDALHQITTHHLGKPTIEVNLEYNLLVEMPLLGFTVPDGPTDSNINVKNNKISVVDLSGCTAICGYWMLKVVNLENNELTQFTREMIKDNWDTEVINFNNNKISQIFSPWTLDGGAYYNLRELYMNNNEIVSLATGAFNYFNDLQILEMRNNKITSLPFNDLFDTIKLTALSSINLMNNKLISIDDQTQNFPRGPSPAVVMNLKGNWNLIHVIDYHESHSIHVQVL